MPDLCPEKILQKCPSLLETSAPSVSPPVSLECGPARPLDRVQAELCYPGAGFWDVAFSQIQKQSSPHCPNEEPGSPRASRWPPHNCGAVGTLTAGGRVPPPSARRRAWSSSTGTPGRSTGAPAAAASSPLSCSGGGGGRSVGEITGGCSA